VVALEPALAFDRLLTAPLPQVFSRRYAGFPPVREVTDEPTDWGSVGQTRTIVLADSGGRMRETLTAVDRPHGYSYVLDDLHGPLRPLIRTVDGGWSFAPDDAGCCVTWAWTLHATRSPARLTLSVIGRMWQGYADRALGEVETLLQRG
jgi:hypothetical protein